MSKELQTPASCQTAVSGRFYEVFDKEKDLELAKDLEKYVKERIYRYLINNYDLEITFEEYLSTYR